MENRVESLDWLRGIMAISVMVFHLMILNYEMPDVSGVFGRLGGIYAVSIFFVLSGLSMAIVYNGRIFDLKSSLSFFIKRIFRIWPLLWLCVIYMAIKGGGVGFERLIINLTATFSLFDPRAYINMGAWSIGNEMVYYALTPFVIAIYDRSKVIGDLLVAISLAVYLYFAFVVLNPLSSLEDQWVLYINPLNNLFLYMVGVFVYYNRSALKMSQVLNCLLVVSSVLIFVFYPVDGNRINIVTGFNRIAFSVLSVLLVIGVYNFALYRYVPRFLASSLSLLGVATYGIYLMHPVVNYMLKSKFIKSGFGDPLLISVVVFLSTIVLAVCSYYTFEKFFMVRGGRVARRICSGPKVTA